MNGCTLSDLRPYLLTVSSQDGPEDSPFTKTVRNTCMRDALTSLRNLIVVAFLCELKSLIGELPQNPSNPIPSINGFDRIKKKVKVGWLYFTIRGVVDLIIVMGSKARVEIRVL